MVNPRDIAGERKKKPNKKQKKTAEMSVWTFEVVGVKHLNKPKNILNELETVKMKWL